MINIDEVGFKGRADATKIKVIVSTDCNGCSIEIPFDRTSKRTSMLCAIAAGGHALKPGTAVPRKTLAEELFQLVCTTENEISCFGRIISSLGRSSAFGLKRH